MLKKLALKLSKDGSRSYEANLYLLRNNLIMFGILILILLLGYFLGVFICTTINVLTVMILRWFSGGSHSKSKITCTVLSVIIPIAFALFTKYIVNYILINQVLVISLSVFIIGLIIIRRYAPADTPQKPILSLEFKKQLKRNSYIFLTIVQLFIIGIYLLNYNNFSGITFSFVLGISWQLFTITPLSYKAMYLLDLAIDKIGGA